MKVGRNTAVVLRMQTLVVCDMCLTRLLDERSLLMVMRTTIQIQSGCALATGYGSNTE